MADRRTLFGRDEYRYWCPYCSQVFTTTPALWRNHLEKHEE